MMSRGGRAVLALACVGALAACSVDNNSSGSKSSSASGSGASGSGASKTVMLVTHESWEPDKNVMAEFTKQTG